MKHIVFVFIALLVLSGCLEFLRYSERAYSYTITIPANQTVQCAFAFETDTEFNYRIVSDMQVDFIIADNKNLAINTTTGKIMKERQEGFAKGYSVLDYRDTVTLGPGSYSLLIFGGDRRSNVRVESNIAMSCA